MSIIERSNPLNLQYRVCIVTSASTPLGIIICKTLLKANALVLGIDSQPKDHSLNAGLGTHFQFEQCRMEDEGAPERIVQAAREKFGLERLDTLVSVLEAGEGGQLRRLGDVVGEAMSREGRGSMVTVVGNGEGTERSATKSASDWTREMASRYQERGVRCNLIESEGGGGGGGQPQEAYQDARAHMTALIKTERIAKDVPSADESQQTAAKLYDIGNLVLFLAGDMGERIAGSTVRLDGSSVSL